VLSVIRVLAKILGFLAFFVVFFSNLPSEHFMELPILVKALLMGMSAGMLFWLIGFILGDIIFKGLVASIQTDTVDVVEGGILQRVHDEQERLNPDVPEEVEEKKEDKKKK